ncbi:hypothetical protein SAMN05421788_109171 [Filimonas lacunae]|uniref:Uncharacterized protein n=1 Tax=Filimonas lacunae TaxID=477680 RepID=A0A173MIP5_9BACT|nr:hypothetical protein [Filimonas lacunae]BAV07475.1 hypothetical protein FLA_3501 [Filimonas lacunae]SIT30237.1 hypothetical protein SAMN05421788_109171 [Filimonas lacunae]
MKPVFLILLLHSLSAFRSNPPLDEIRSQYALSVTDKQVCKRMIVMLQSTTQQPVSLAYLGAFQAIWANHTWNPLEKLSSFKKGKRNIEKAVATGGNEVEIHFVRLSIQYNVPKMLRYHSEINADKNFILSHYASIPNSSLRLLILQFFQKTDLLTEAELSRLSQQQSVKPVPLTTVK